MIIVTLPVDVIHVVVFRSKSKIPPRPPHTILRFLLKNPFRLVQYFEELEKPSLSSSIRELIILITILLSIRVGGEEGGWSVVNL